MIAGEVRSLPRIREILATARTIAVLGASTKSERPAHYVPEYLHKHGYRIIPVNPMETEVLGERAYPDLESIPDQPYFTTVEAPQKIDVKLAAKLKREVGRYSAIVRAARVRID